MNLNNDSKNDIICQRMRDVKYQIMGWEEPREDRKSINGMVDKEIKIELANGKNKNGILKHAGIYTIVVEENGSLKSYLRNEISKCLFSI